MNAVFADTFSGRVALSDPSDLRYRDALLVENRLGAAKIVTTDEVLSEFLTFFAADAWLESVSQAVLALLNSKSVQVLPQSRESSLAGLELYRARPDKGYSLTDCISMQTMRREGLTEVLTNGRHFEQEGFRTLFRDS